MRTGAALGVVLLLVSPAHGQQRNAHWPIPPGSWLHFQGDGTTVEPWLESSFYNRQSASISSPAGVLQLYNDQRSIVYNANGDILLPGGIGSDSIVVAGQGWLYCPWPGDGDRVAGFGIKAPGPFTDPILSSYTFFRDGPTAPWQLDAGSTQVLNDSVTYKLTAVAHANGADYWVITTLPTSDAFAAYRLSASGVDPMPVISHTGIQIPVLNDGHISYLPGTLVASYDGTQLALTYAVIEVGPHQMYTDLYHFDASTGVVTAYASLPVLPNTWKYGTEFSLDGTKLYQLQGTFDGGAQATSTLRQFELSSQDPAQIAASEVIIRSDSGLAGEPIWGRGYLLMATGPDGRIYVVWRNNGRLSVINEPNAAGVACNFVVDQIQLPDTLAHTLPNQIKRYHDSAFSVGVAQALSDPTDLAVWPVPTEGLLQVRSPHAGQVIVVDALGRTVLARPIGQHSTLTVDLSGSSAGTYTLQVLAPGTAPIHRMVIKR